VAKIKINRFNSQKQSSNSDVSRKKNPKLLWNLGLNILFYSYMAANCTFCCNSSTFSLNTVSVSIRSLTVWQE